MTQTEVFEGKLTTRAHMQKTGAILSGPGILWLLVFLLLPTAFLIVLAFANRGAYGSIDWTFSLTNLERLLGFGSFGWSPDNLLILWRSVQIAVFTTVLCIAIGLPMAFWIANHDNSMRKFLFALIMVPSCTNLVIRTAAWMILLGPDMFPAKVASFLGIIAVADELKEDSAASISELKKMGIYTVMLSGDNKRTASAVAKKARVDEVVAGILPGEKANEIRRLQARGKVAMVGDGINDAPALAQANVGMAIGAGTDVAIDAADIVLVNSGLEDVTAAIRLSRATLWNIRENLFWAFFYNVALMPLAAGVYYSINGWSMHPVLGACAMSLSSFCVVMNALRLNFKQIHSDRREECGTNVSRDLRVEGMMCTHCEARVREALLSISGIVNVKADHRKKRVKIECSSVPSEESLKEAIQKAGYTYKG